MTYIGTEAFCSTRLTSIELPDSVTQLGYDVFCACADMKSAVLSAGMTEIPVSMFYLCSSLESIVIPESVTVIGSLAFYSCTSLANVELPEGLVQIGTDAFEDCTSLTAIAIPSTVELIQAAFRGCTALAEIIFSGDAPQIVDETAFENVAATCYYSAGNATWTEDVMRNYGGTLTWVASDIHGTWGDNLTWTLSADGVLTISGEGAMASASDYDDDLGWVFSWTEYRDCITAVIIEDGVSTVAEGAFRDCPMTAVSLPETLTKIGTGAFAGSGLISVEIPDSVTTLNMSAFCGCEALVSAKLPAGLEFAAEGVFSGCPSLTTVVMPEMPNYEINSLSLYALFEGCDALTSIDFVTFPVITEFMFAWCDGLEEIVIPECVEGIWSCAFRECLGLTDVTIPGSVTQLQNNAFLDCVNLASITFEGDAPSIGSEAFSGVTATAYYPANNATWTEDILQSYGGTITWAAYAEEEPATSGTCGDELTWNFDTTTGTLTITGTGEMYDYESMSDAPWYALKEQITAVVVEEGVTSIGSWAFCCADQMVNLALPITITRIGEYAFWYGNGSSLARVDFPDVGVWCGIEFKNSYCNPLASASELYVLTQLTTVLDIPQGTEAVNDYAFFCFQGVEEVILPESVTKLGAYAFFATESLRSVTVYGNLESVGKSAFSMSCVETIRFWGDAPADPENLFDFYNSQVTVYYPANNDTWTDVISRSYSADILWVPFDADVTASGICGDNLTWTLDRDGILTISGEGAMYDYAQDAAPWLSYQDQITGIVLEDGLTRIGSYAFAFRDSLESLIVPASVTSIGACAFYGDTFYNEGLRYVYFEGNPPAFDDMSLSGRCFFLLYPAENENWPAEIPENALDCTQYCQAPYDENGFLATGSCGEGVYWEYSGDGLIRIYGQGAMTDYMDNGTPCKTPWDWFDDEFTTLVVEEGVTNLGDLSFEMVHGLTSISLPESLTRIGAFAITSENLKNINIPSNVAELDYCALYCDNLETIIFTGSAPTIVNDLFSGLTATAYYPGWDETWTEDTRAAFGGNITWIANEIPPVVYGDVNADEEIDLVDVLLIIAYYNETADLTAHQFTAADVSGDGEVDLADATLIIQYYNELIISFPVEN